MADISVAMGFYRFQVSQYRTGDLPRDWCVNTLYFNISGDPVTPPDDLDAIGDDIVDAYVSNLQSYLSSTNYDVKAYNMADPEPRPVASHRTRSGLTGGDEGNRDVALCLSYFVDRNLPRQRGRIYLGPFRSTVAGVARPVGGLPEAVIAFGQDLAAIGGLNVDWSLYSPTRNAHERIGHIWSDNEWDTQRRRGRGATGRLTADING